MMIIEKEEKMEIKEKICTVAGDLFMKNGIKNVSMDEIARKLGMSKRTIYMHFTDKEDILVYFLKYWEKNKMIFIQKLSTEQPSGIHIFLTYLDPYSKFLETNYNIKFQEDIEKYFPKAFRCLEEQRERGINMTKEFLQTGIKQGLIRKNLNIDLAAFLLQETNNTFLNASHMPSRSFTIGELFKTMLITFIRGISTEKGSKIVDDYLKKQETTKK